MNSASGQWYEVAAAVLLYIKPAFEWIRAPYLAPLRGKKGPEAVLDTYHYITFGYKVQETGRNKKYSIVTSNYI